MSAPKASSSTKSPNIVVTVRIRPPSEFEKGNKHSTLAVKCMDERVVIFDPADLNKPQNRGPQGVRRGKDIAFGFDRVFDQYATQYEVFQHTTQALVNEVLNGYNCACFAYGATGAGKTYTMVGTESAPGVMVLTLQELFSAMKANQDEKRYSVRMSYLEVYNENIHDLLTPQQKPLNLLDCGDTMTVQGLTYREPNSAEEVLTMLQEGNTRRAQNFTHANAESSRSHAVLQVTVEIRERTANVATDVRTAKFSLIDLAGSERASRTKNQGKQLVEGANINRSLLALGNCINALASGYSEGKYVPYRDSKLTRLLKDTLGGNCKTVMISNVSPSTLSYEDTFNTLQYANRAKNIKCKVRANEIHMVTHMSEYKLVIAELRKEVEEWKAKCIQFEQQLEEEGRAKQAAIDQEFNEQVSTLSRQDYEATRTDLSLQTPQAPKRNHSVYHQAPNTVSSTAVGSSLPLLSRTVSIGLQTPRNVKTGQRLLNISSEVNDLVTDRRNVQKHLEEVNGSMTELNSRKSYLLQQIRARKSRSNSASPTMLDGLNTQEQIDPNRSPLATMSTPEKSRCMKYTPSPPHSVQMKRELDVVQRKLEENNALRSTLLQRLGRNAETCKRLQTQLAEITPHIEDADLYRQLKLELVINALEITNFNRSMHESQLALALTASQEKTARAFELAKHMRSLLTEIGYEEPIELLERYEEIEDNEEEMDFEVVQLPSPFASRSPQVCNIAHPISDMDEAPPSTPSRLVTDSITSMAKGKSSSRPRVTFATSNSQLSSTVAAPKLNKYAKSSSGVQTISSASSGTKIVAHVRSGSQPSVKKSATTTSSTTSSHSSVSRTVRASMIPTSVSHAPSAISRPIISRTSNSTTANVSSSSSLPATNSVKSATNSSMLGPAKRVGMGPPQRGAKTTSSTASTSTTSTSVHTNGATAKPFQGNSDARRITPTKLSHRYRHDPAVAKALAGFKPAFEPQERSTPPTARKVTIPKSQTAKPKVETPTNSRNVENRANLEVSANIPQPATPTSTETASSTPTAESLRSEPNPLAALLSTNSSQSYAPLSSSIYSGTYSIPPTVAPMMASISSPSTAEQTYSPLLTLATTSRTLATDSPISPMAKPIYG